MTSEVEASTHGAPAEPPSGMDPRLRMHELEEENERLRLLVSELLVTNQRLRESARAVLARNQELEGAA